MHMFRTATSRSSSWFIRIGIFIMLTGCTTEHSYLPLDLTIPGHSQRELDAYAAESVVLRVPYIDTVLTPEYLRAYELAVDRLDQLREIKPYYGRAGDYQIGFGETENEYVISFLSRFRNNSPDLLKAMEPRRDWRAFYNTGEAPALIIAVSKLDFSITRVEDIIS